MAFTDHPAPSHDWLTTSGLGHDSLDPLSALAFAAGVTSRIRLLTFMLVLPYRNPFLTAKQAATVDVLSGGRLTLGVAPGYVESEFTALGVDFSERNTLTDEGLEVLLGAWSTENFQYDGRHFTARGQTLRPRPTQEPHPPIWVGGNSRRARKRAARWGQGWAFVLVDSTLAQATRTAPIATVEDVAAAVRDLWSLAEEAGRDPAEIDVVIQTPPGGVSDIGAVGSDERWQEEVQALKAAGVTWLVLEPPNDDLDRCLEVLGRVGTEVLPGVC